MITFKTDEQYEAIKAQILEEQRAERRERAKERQRINNEAWAMFDETKAEYLPKLVVKHGKRTGAYDCACECERKIEAAIFSTLRIIGERNRKTAYMNGRKEEANTVLRRLLDELLA